MFKKYLKTIESICIKSEEVFLNNWQLIVNYLDFFTTEVKNPKLITNLHFI